MLGVKCHRCHKRKATVKIVRIIGGEAHSIYLCDKCAAEVSPYHKQALSLQEAIEKVLAQLLEKQTTSEEGEPEEAVPDIECPSCGTTLEEYRKTFMMGCSECYKTFGSFIEGQLKRLHGSTRHVGQAPPPVRKQVDDLEATVSALKKELAEAVSAEDFERAAKLRDRIRHLRGELGDAFPKMPEM